MRLGQRAWTSLGLLGAMIFASSALAESKYNLTRGVTPISHDLYDLHMLILYICIGIAIVVFGVMFYAVFRHRKSRGAQAAKFHENTTVEFVWAIIPTILLVLMAIPATKVLIDMSDTSDSDITIKVTGYQWRWEYEYLDEGIRFFSNLSTPREQIEGLAPRDKWYLLEVDNPVVVPINKKIRFLITSNDVIHSWWVPALGFKKDAVPGFIHEQWAKIDKPGIYRGQCAELCGVNHGFMPIVVEAKTQEDYDAWLESQNIAKVQASAADQQSFEMQDLMAKGKKVYDTTCAACHKQDGSGMPPAFPSLVKSPIITGPVDIHLQMVLDGVAGTAMQAFGSQLSDAEIAAVVTYERNAWGNDMGDVVQPADVKAQRAR